MNINILKAIKRNTAVRPFKIQSERLLGALLNQKVSEMEMGPLMVQVSLAACRAVISNKYGFMSWNHLLKSVNTSLSTNMQGKASFANYFYTDTNENCPEEHLRIFRVGTSPLNRSVNVPHSALSKHVRSYVKDTEFLKKAILYAQKHMRITIIIESDAYKLSNKESAFLNELNFMEVNSIEELRQAISSINLGEKANYIINEKNACSFAYIVEDRINRLGNYQPKEGMLVLTHCVDPLLIYPNLVKFSQMRAAGIVSWMQLGENVALKGSLPYYQAVIANSYNTFVDCESLGKINMIVDNGFITPHFKMDKSIICLHQGQDTLIPFI